MADKQISQLVAATTLNNEDLLVIQQGQIAKKLSGERLAMFVYLAAGSMIDEVNSAVEEAQAAVDELLEEKNAIAQTIADMAGLGTDTTLTTPAMAADSKAVGDRIADVEKDALAGLNQKTISDVAIASFDDGADDVPVKELIVNIDPVQDLHGQDAPYPAGGGVNKMPYPTARDATFSDVHFVSDGKGKITVSGTASANDYCTFMLDSSFTIPDGSAYKVCFCNNVAVGNSPIVAFYNGSIQIDSWSLNSVNKSASYSAMSNKTCDRIIINIASGTAYNFTLQIMFVPNGTDTTAYIPYSNICPITGWTGCEATRTGKNVLPLKFYTGIGYNSNVGTTFTPVEYTGEITKSGNSYTADADSWWGLGMISNKLKPGKYKVNIKVSATSIRSTLYVLDDTYTVIYKHGNTSIAQTWTPMLTITEPSYIVVGLLSSSTGTITYTAPQIELGEVFTGYEEYSGTTLSVAFPSEAGTVYGARLNLTTGKLIVDTAARQFDGSGDVYSFVSNGRVNIDFAGIDYKKGLDKDSGISNSYAGLMQTANNANFDSSANNYASCYNISSSANNFTVRIKDPRFVDLNTAQGILEEEPLVIIFNLNTPIVYNLTPIEVRTLLKINNIWANTGNINTLIYRTIPITEEVIRAIMGDYEEIITGVESTGKATKNYYAGNLVIINDILYKCLVNVASGETFTPGAGGNVSQTTIADELATLQALYDNLGNLALLSYTTA